MDNTQILIDKITKAIGYQFKSDGTKPGLTISWLDHKKKYYVSIVRWKSGEKEVVCKATDENINSALQNMARQFLALQFRSKDPVDDLNDLVVVVK